MLQGFAESLQHCIRPQSSVTALYGSSSALKLPCKEVTEFWGVAKFLKIPVCTLQLIHSWQGNFKAWSRSIWKFWLHHRDCYHGLCSIMTTRTNSVEIHLDGGDISVLISLCLPLLTLTAFGSTLCQVMWVLIGESRKLATYKHLGIRLAIRMSWWITVRPMSMKDGWSKGGKSFNGCKRRLAHTWNRRWVTERQWNGVMRLPNSCITELRWSVDSGKQRYLLLCQTFPVLHWWQHLKHATWHLGTHTISGDCSVFLKGETLHYIHM